MFLALVSFLLLDPSIAPSPILFSANSFSIENTVFNIPPLLGPRLSIVGQKKKSIVGQMREAEQDDLLIVNKIFPLTVNRLLPPFFHHRLIFEKFCFQHSALGSKLMEC